MRVQLDTPNPAIPQEELGKIDTNNVLKLQQTINKTGAAVLTDKLLNTATTLAISATQKKIDYFEAVITCSGGLVEIDFYSTFEVGTGVNLKFYLIVDGKQVASMGAANPNAAINVPGSLKYKAKLGEGRHTVYMAYITNGAFIISSDSLDSRLLISETVL